MDRRPGSLANVCECCAGPVYAWVPLPGTDPLLSLPECMECGLLTCMPCRLHHVLGHNHEPCRRGGPFGE